MRPLILLTIVIVIFSCNDQPGMETPTPLSKDQQNILAIADSFSYKIYGAGNSEMTHVMQDSAIKVIGSYLKDSTKLNQLKDFEVTVGNVQTMPVGGRVDLYAYVRDGKFKYWMEIPYDSEKQMHSDSIYKTVVKLKEGEHRRVNMFYMDEIKVETGLMDEYEVRVIFLPDKP